MIHFSIILKRYTQTCSYRKRINSSRFARSLPTIRSAYKSEKNASKRKIMDCNLLTSFSVFFLLLHLTSRRSTHQNWDKSSPYFLDDILKIKLFSFPETHEPNRWRQIDKRMAHEKTFPWDFQIVHILQSLLEIDKNGGREISVRWQKNIVKGVKNVDLLAEQRLNYFSPVTSPGTLWIQLITCEIWSRNLLSFPRPIDRFLQPFRESLRRFSPYCRASQSLVRFFRVFSRLLNLFH